MKLYTRQFIVVANFGWRRENMRLIERNIKALIFRVVARASLMS